jgi:pseudouridine-5'-phosphate glycosidase
LLDRVFTLTDGKSLVANIALVLNNARLGAAIATEIVQARAA